MAIESGTRRRLDLFAARLPTQTPLGLPVEVVSGRQPGPRLWLSAAIHGDELNGMEIIRRVLGRLRARSLRGDVIAVPIVNVFGFIHQDRYLPDRRDLNRSFPGSRRGSLAARLAHLFMTEIVAHCTHGLDLHTGSNHRVNLPQVRGDLRDPEVRRCAVAFGAPIMIQGSAPRKSLRDAAQRLGIPILVYEAGAPLRFDRRAIRIGVRGVLRVMAELEMWDEAPARETERPLEARRRTWVRAPRSGVLHLSVRLGARVEKGRRLGQVLDVFGEDRSVIRSPSEGLVIGHTDNPLVSQGDGIIHLARGVVRSART